jgi:hypothetical protein
MARSSPAHARNSTAPSPRRRSSWAGFFLIDARDLNEAIEVASKILSARTGSIEVRPISEGDGRQP